MERITRRRAAIVLAFFCVILFLFSLKLYEMQVSGSPGSSPSQKTFITRTVVKAARGEILDRNGKVLVTNRSCR